MEKYIYFDLTDTILVKNDLRFTCYLPKYNWGLNCSCPKLVLRCMNSTTYIVIITQYQSCYSACVCVSVCACYLHTLLLVFVSLLGCYCQEYTFLWISQIIYLHTCTRKIKPLSLIILMFMLIDSLLTK